MQMVLVMMHHYHKAICRINFTFCSCPIGFQPKVAIETRCECECNSDLFPYVIMCDTEANVKGDLKINLAAIGVVVICSWISSREVKFTVKWQIEILEVVCHSNLALLCIITLETQQ